MSFILVLDTRITSSLLEKLQCQKIAENSEAIAWSRHQWSGSKSYARDGDISVSYSLTSLFFNVMLQSVGVVDVHVDLLGLNHVNQSKGPTFTLVGGSIVSWCSAVLSFVGSERCMASTTEISLGSVVQCVRKKTCFCNILYKTRYIVSWINLSENCVNVFNLTWVISLHYLVKL